MASVRVLDFQNMDNFDDACMDHVIALLNAYPQIFALNLGEKEHVTPGGWRSLLDHLWKGNIVCLFVVRAGHAHTFQ